MHHLIHVSNIINHVKSNSINIINKHNSPYYMQIKGTTFLGISLFMRYLHVLYKYKHCLLHKKIVLSLFKDLSIAYFVQITMQTVCVNKIFAYFNRYDSYACEPDAAPRIHPKLSFYPLCSPINKYSNNSGVEYKLILKSTQITSFCTDSCFVTFKSQKTCNLSNVFMTKIMIVDPRARGKPKSMSNKTILGGIVCSLDEYPNNYKAIKYHK